MAWYNNIFGGKPEEVEEKLNPAQFHMDNGIESSREPSFSYELAYEDLEIVNRGVNMIVDDVAEIPTMEKRKRKEQEFLKKLKNNYDKNNCIRRKQS